MIRVGKLSTPRVSAPERSLHRWILSALRILRVRGWLRPRRIGCLLLLVIVTMWWAARALDEVTARFSNHPPAVAGSPFDTVAPPRPAGSGSATIERILRRDRLIVAIRESPGLMQRSSSGGYTGFEVALLDVIAHDLGVDPARTSFKPLSPDSRQAALRRSEVDLVLPGEESVAGPYLVRAGTEYSVGLPPGDTVLHDRITAALRHAIEDGSWTRAYRQYLGDPVPVPPVPR